MFPGRWEVLPNQGTDGLDVACPSPADISLRRGGLRRRGSPALAEEDIHVLSVLFLPEAATPGKGERPGVLDVDPGPRVVPETAAGPHLLASRGGQTPQG